MTGADGGDEITIHEVHGGGTSQLCLHLPVEVGGSFAGGGEEDIRTEGVVWKRLELAGGKVFRRGGGGIHFSAGGKGV